MSDISNFHRLYLLQNGKHTWFGTKNDDDVTALKGTWESRNTTYTANSPGPIGGIFNRDHPNLNLAPLYRLYLLQNGVHTWFFTTKESDVNELKGSWEPRSGNFTVRGEGPIGYVFKDPGPDRLPLYRLYKNQGGVHTWFFTTKESDVNELKGEWESRCTHYTAPSDGPICYILNPSAIAGYGTGGNVSPGGSGNTNAFSFNEKIPYTTSVVVNSAAFVEVNHYRRQFNLDRAQNVHINLHIPFVGNDTAGRRSRIQLRVDGETVCDSSKYNTKSWELHEVTFTALVQLAPGQHTVTVFACVDGGTLRMPHYDGGSIEHTVKDSIFANLLVIGLGF